MLKIPDALVDCHWLHQHLDDENLIVLDATLPKVTNKGKEEIQHDVEIPKARFFDIKNLFSEENAPFPNTLLTPEKFEQRARELGVNNDSGIVVYDIHGVYSSPRVWWMFKAMGLDNVAVLNGGLPKWISEGYKTEEKKDKNPTTGNFTAKYNSRLFVDAPYVLNSLNKLEEQILDARSLSRFQGQSPEPRKGVRSGHIPNSKSLPYASVLKGSELRSKEELKSLYQQVNQEDKPMVFSCGSGITACVLALGATIAGYNQLTVYDGSWTEWGSLHDLPIEV
ncbi:sulfurtransferase [Pseudotenacibaculum haliotis]|uniref:Sulfurtransferase n=1 Tax=Pseudotenacibaculum haliotis TaxID=1862138 RepID=A0ABW5LUZ1_9FLAO